MGRRLLPVVVVLTDTTLLVASRWGGVSVWVVALYALAVSLVVALRPRAPIAAFGAAVVLASLTGAAYVLLLWAAYQAGREIVSRSGTAMVVGAAVGGLAVQLATQPVAPRSIPHLASAYAVFVALPLLAGRYVAQHERLVSALDRHNRQLRRQRELLADQERLRERLRIARDMHDSLGHRLSLVSVQAAALEVSELPRHQRHAVRQLATAARAAMDELHELVSTLRRGAEDETSGLSPGVEAIDATVREFQAAGVPVTLRRRGQPRPLSAAAGLAAYRVVEEGLTNAAKHGPGLPVTVSLAWEPDALLVTITNPLPDRAAGASAGHGLCGLGERVRPAGGFLDHRRSGDEFRLVAMLPTVTEPATGDDVPEAGRIRTFALGTAIAALIFVFLPAAMLLGVR